jgi:protein gp37
MNQTAIEWTNFTWNPVTGCWGPGGTAEKPNRCAYCYAHKIAHRFKVQQYQTEFSEPFAPTFHHDRLNQPAKVKKSSRIFVCSMADLFGDWVPQAWIEAVLKWGVGNAPQHTFQFLTKNPKRLKDFNPWPANCWVGTTVTNQADADERLPWLVQVDAPVRFVSHEPLLSAIDVLPWIPGPWPMDTPMPTHNNYISWAIIGAQTGPGAVKPTDEWVSALIRQYRAAQVPIFLKDNLYPPDAPATVKFQEWPA